MNILFVNTFYYPNMPGGAEQSVKLLAEGLVRKGHNVAVFAADSKDGTDHFEEEYNGVKVYRYTTGKFDLFRFSYEKSKVGKFEKIQQKLLTYYNRLSEKNFISVCQDFKPDIVHTNTLFGIPNTVWKTAYKMKIPVVHTIRDTAIVSAVQYGHNVSSVVEKMHRLYMAHYSKFVSAVTAPSEYTLQTSLKTGAFKKSIVKKCIFNSVNVDYDMLHRNIELRKKRSSDRIKFLYAGRLIYLKGIEQMIRAFSILDYKNCELHICGAGDMVDYVQHQIEKDNRIKYYGKLTSEELAEQYKECDVLLFPSVWPEPFGRVFIEGNMYGLPVIAGNCGGIPEIFSVTHAGDLCNCDDIEEFLKLLKKYLNRSSYLKCFESIEKNIHVFDINLQIDEFEKTYYLLSKLK